MTNHESSIQRWPLEGWRLIAAAAIDVAAGAAITAGYIYAIESRTFHAPMLVMSALGVWPILRLAPMLIRLSAPTLRRDLYLANVSAAPFLRRQLEHRHWLSCIPSVIFLIGIFTMSMLNYSKIYNLLLLPLFVLILLLMLLTSTLLGIKLLATLTNPSHHHHAALWTGLMAVTAYLFYMLLFWLISYVGGVLGPGFLIIVIIFLMGAGLMMRGAVPRIWYKMADRYYDHLEPQVGE